MEKIVFLLPNSGRKPVGGFKVVYEYANKFASDGFEVTIIHSASVFAFEQGLNYFLRSIFRFLYNLLLKSYLPDPWFILNKKIETKWVYSLKKIDFSPYNIAFATSWHTAYYLSNNKSNIDIKKYYLIQHYENWDDNEESLVSTWKDKNLNKIVIAPWLYRISQKLNQKSKLLYNGFSPNEFFIQKPLEDRNPFTIAMLYHIQPFKGVSFGLEVLEQLKLEQPEIEVNLFGVFDLEIKLPNWIKYFKNPSRREMLDIYNNSSIFLGTSSHEGFGLTIGEAMLCGCCVVCTNNEGYSIMAKNNRTALVSDFGDVEQMKNNLKLAMLDYNLRCSLSRNGNNYLKKFTWDNSYVRLKKILNV